MVEMDGALLVAHGSRDPDWSQPFETVAQLLRDGRPGLAVELGFVEIQEPRSLEAGDALARQGCRHVLVVPLFLGAGHHVRVDMAKLLEQLRENWRGVEWRLAPAIGEMPVFHRAVAGVLDEALRTGLEGP